MLTLYYLLPGDLEFPQFYKLFCKIKNAIIMKFITGAGYILNIIPLTVGGSTLLYILIVLLYSV